MFLKREVILCILQMYICYMDTANSHFIQSLNSNIVMLMKCILTFSKYSG